jgi:hypothetical protein
MKSRRPVNSTVGLRAWVLQRASAKATTPNLTTSIEWRAFEFPREKRCQETWTLWVKD